MSSAFKHEVVESFFIRAAVPGAVPKEPTVVARGMALVEEARFEEFFFLKSHLKDKNSSAADVVEGEVAFLTVEVLTAPLGASEAIVAVSGFVTFDEEWRLAARMEMDEGLVAVGADDVGDDDGGEDGSRPNPSAGQLITWRECATGSEEGGPTSKSPSALEKFASLAIVVAVCGQPAKRVTDIAPVRL